MLQGLSFAVLNQLLIQMCQLDIVEDELHDLVRQSRQPRVVNHSNRLVHATRAIV